MNRFRFALSYLLPIIVIASIATFIGTIKSKPIYAPNKSNLELSYIPDINITANISFSAQAAVIYDLDHDIVLKSKNPDQYLAPASLTKLFTTFVATKHFSWNQKITIQNSYNDLPEHKLGLAIGDEISIEDLIKSSLIMSANDSAEQLAALTSINELNQTMADLGLKSHFMNGSGLDANGHQASARELSLLAKAIFDQKEIMEIMSTASSSVKVNSQDHAITHTHQMIGEEKSGVWKVLAGKTGTTPQAGECLLTIAMIKQGQQEHHVAIVLLSSPDRYQETRDILNNLSS